MNSDDSSQGPAIGRSRRIAPDRARSVLEHVERVMDTHSLDAIWTLHAVKMAEYGFDRLLYAFSRFLDGRGMGDPDDVLILSTLPSAYLDGLIRGGRYRHSPMLHWAVSNLGACSWREVQARYADGTLPAEQCRIIEFNRGFDIHAGYTISLDDGSMRGRGAIGLYARAQLDQAEVDRIWTEFGREILIINSVTHQRIAALPNRRGRRVLTDRQREALAWIGDGKTVQDTATIMGVTGATVEKHLRLARESLGVQTTPQAVLKAHWLNQINVPAGTGGRGGSTLS